MSSLSQVFEDEFDGSGKYSDDSPRKRLVRALEGELPGEDFILDGSGSNRVRLQNKDFFRLYVAVMRLKGEEPEFLWNGSRLISRERFEELDSDPDTCSESLRRLWDCSDL